MSASWYSSGGVEIHVGHVLDVLAALPAGSVQTCVTSPPYYGLRSYSTTPQIWGGDPLCSHSLEATAPGKVLTGGTGTASEKQVSNAGSQYGNAWEDVHPPGYRSSDTHPGSLQSEGNSNRERLGSRVCSRCDAWSGELGSEPIPDCLALLRGLEPCSQCFVCHLVIVFRAVRRVLHDSGTCWVNLGDSYNSSPPGNKNPMSKSGLNGAQTSATYRARLEETQQHQQEHRTLTPGLGPKQLMMMPARVALALQADGWVLRSAITWAKKSPMPESVRDRPTNATEMVYLLAKNPTYHYDAEAVRTPNTPLTVQVHSRYPEGANLRHHKAADAFDHRGTLHQNGESSLQGANLRNFWLLGPEPLKAQHYAAYPTKLVEPCILAGTSARGCCSACLAPWERVVERGDLEAEPGYENTERIYAKGINATEAQHRGANFIKDGFQPNRRYAQTTTGWRPTCRCEGVEVIPCTVLDPFLGSGTTAFVARHHGRRAIGIELSPDYATLCADRLKQGTLGLEVW